MKLLQENIARRLLKGEKMRRKITKKFMALMCVAVMGVIGSESICWAATGGITATVTTNRMSGVYTYGEQGHQLKIELYGYERKGSGELIVKKSAVANGSYTSVSTWGTPDAGYYFYQMSAYGFVDSNLDAAKLNVTI